MRRASRARAPAPTRAAGALSLPPPAPAGNWLDGVEQSLLYCSKHPLVPETGQAAFSRAVLVSRAGQPDKPQAEQREYRLVRPDLLLAFLRHYAQQTRHLESSRRLLAEVGARLLLLAGGWPGRKACASWHGAVGQLAPPTRRLACAEPLCCCLRPAGGGAGAAGGRQAGGGGSGSVVI